MTQTQHNPIRCFEGDTKPHEAFWNWKNEEGAEPELDFDGYISEYSWFEDDITPQMFKADLEANGKGGPITIKLNSYGGDVIAAAKIHSIIRDYPGQVTVHIDSIAASAATVVAMAGDWIKMNETAFFMIHDPSMVFFLAQVNLEDMKRMAASLEAVKEGIVNAYETKTGLSRARLSKLMTDETWMDAQKATDLGFVNEVVKGSQKVLVLPKNTAVVNALSNFANVPPAVMQALQSDVQPEVTSEPLTAEQQREAQFLRERVDQILNKGESHA